MAMKKRLAGKIKYVSEEEINEADMLNKITATKKPFLKKIKPEKNDNTK